MTYRVITADLRGDPDQVAAVADSLEYGHKYTSGVIAWAPEDQPSDEEIGEVLDEFEKTAWGSPPTESTLTAAADRRTGTSCSHLAVNR